MRAFQRILARCRVNFVCLYVSSISICSAQVTEFNAASLAAKVCSLAQGQPPGWEANALRALDNENEFVRRGFFAKSDAAAISYISGLIAGRCYLVTACDCACMHANLRNSRPRSSFLITP